MKIFISYGHDEFSKVADKIRSDLILRGFDVWFDHHSLEPKSPWDAGIENGIHASDLMIIIMTRHALRRPDGVCLDELSFARMLGKPITPIMVEATQPPLLIARIQWLDMQDVLDIGTGDIRGDRYDQKFGKLLSVISSDCVLSFDGLHLDLNRVLKPFDNEIDLAEKLKNFIGRDWLMREFDTWINTRSNSRVFFIIGSAGTGKSALAAKLAHSHNNVVGIHFCRWYDKARCDIRKILLSLAFSLATQIPKYAEYISENVDFYNIETKSLGEIFDLFYLLPLNKIAPAKTKVVVAIDGLDEIDSRQQKEFLTVFTKNISALPEWFGLVLTSRPESSLMQWIKVLKPMEITATPQENLADLRKFLAMRLANVDLKISEGLKEQILEKSDGNFLYLTQLLEDFAASGEENFDVNSYPVGMGRVFCEYFDRIFSDADDYRKNVRPILELIVGAKSPLNVDVICEILNTDEYEIDEVLIRFGILIQRRESGVCFYHKSLKDWLTDKEISVIYYCSQKQAQKRFCYWIKTRLLQFSHSAYLLEYGFSHLSALKEWNVVRSLIELDNQLVLESFINFVVEAARSEEIDELNDLFAQLCGNRNHVKMTVECLVALMDHGFEEASKKLSSWISGCYGQEWIKVFHDLLSLKKSGNSSGVINTAEELQRTCPPDSSIQSLVAFYLAEGLREKGQHKAAVENYRRVLVIIKDLQKSSRYLLALGNLADLEYVNGNIVASLHLVENMKNLGVSHGIRAENFKIQRVSGHVHQALKQLNEAKDLHGQSLRTAELLMMPENIARACNSLAECSALLDSTTVSFLERARGILERVGAHLELGKGYYIEAQLNCNVGLWQTGLDLAAQALKILTRVGYGSGIARCHSIIGKANFLKGDYKAALEHHLLSTQYYRDEMVYPNLRAESYLEILKCASILGKLTEFGGVDSFAAIQNAENYPWLESVRDEINDILALKIGQR